MTQYRDLHYSDTNDLNKLESNAATAPIKDQGEDAEYEAKLKAQLEAGEISEGQYNTLTHTNRTSYENAEVSTQINEDGIIAGLANLVPLPAEDESQLDVSQEQTPQYQIDASY